MNKSGVKLALGQYYAAWLRAPTQFMALKRVPRGAPILVTGPYRSGTTWVGRMLAGEGIWHLHEPFSPHHGIWPEYFSYRRASEIDCELHAFASRLLTGKEIGKSDAIFSRGIQANRRGMPSRLGLYSYAVTRVLIKDPIACLLSEYLVRNHGMTTVLVLRHPAGFAGSLSKLGWDTAEQIGNLLRCQTLMEDWLHPYETLLTRVATAASLESHAALFGALWTVLWGFAQRNAEFLLVNYENLCASPEREFAALHQKLNLPLSDNDVARHARLTRAEADPESAATFQVARNTELSQRSWSRRMTSAEIGLVRSIWEKFELPFFLQSGDW